MNDTQATATIELAPINDRIWQLSGSGDFNNDNTTDLLWYNHNTGEIVTWSLENAAIKERAQFDSQQTDTQWQLQGSGDFDGNGTDDLLWIHTSQNQAAIWFMNGLSRTQPQAIIRQTMQAGQNLGAIADYNQDGKADLTWYTPTGQSETWLMNGNIVTQTLGLRSPDTSSSWQILG
ncbi:MAG: VCBS repeat-containing protein [Synechococcales cyanobacterium RU_4_20]|nr:VCBS repeat-containing protein [Synechococcales cyanobacterium RU_4_20]NJR67553.1 VCBS repeat-containing protein [Synechococcales cyanobacterium CRU_2_2]